MKENICRRLSRWPAMSNTARSILYLTRKGRCKLREGIPLFEDNRLPHKLQTSFHCPPPVTLRTPEKATPRPPSRGTPNHPFCRELTSSISTYRLHEERLFIRCCWLSSSFVVIVTHHPSVLRHDISRSPLSLRLPR